GQLHQPRGPGAVPPARPAPRAAAARGLGAPVRDRPAAGGARHGLRRHLPGPAGGGPGEPGARRAGRPAGARPRADPGAVRTGTAMIRLTPPDPLGLYSGPITHWIVLVVGMLLVVFVILTGAAYTVWFERIELGHMQRRPGPNRVGPWGLMQLAADGVKLVFKESFAPRGVDGILYVLAPAIMVVAAFL